MVNPVSEEMLPQQRQRLILQRLATQGRVLAVSLASEFGVSEDSIRRDLRDLAAQGLCQRVYGGALPLSQPLQPLKQRRVERTELKLALARAALHLLRPGQVLLIDAGSTNRALASVLPLDQQLTVVTNAPDVAQALAERDSDIEVLLIGGRFDPRSGAVIGARAIEQLRDLRADLCFPGACAIDPEQGLWGVNAEESLFKRAMVECSDQTVVLVTSDKLGAHASHKVVGIENVQHLVLQHEVDAAVVAGFAEHGISVHRAAAVDAV